MQKKAINKMVFIVIITIAMSCVSNKKPTCQFQEIKTLYYDENMHVGVDTAYGYTVLIKDFSRECMDSATIINIALKYMDTVTGGTPVNDIAFYNSDKDFIPYEHSQVMEEINKSCLVNIVFDDRTKKPNSFVFYNDKGDIVYWGQRWIPFPKGKDVYEINSHIK